LSELFLNKVARNALKSLREDIKEFSSYLESKPLMSEDVSQTIRSLITAKLVGEEEVTQSKR